MSGKTCYCKKCENDHKYLIAYNDDWMEVVHCLTVEEAILHGMCVARRDDTIWEFEIFNHQFGEHIEYGSKWHKSKIKNDHMANSHYAVVTVGYSAKEDIIE